MLIALFTIAGSPPNRRCHSPWLMMTTGTRAADVLLRQERAAERRPHAERVPEAVGDLRAEEHLRLAAAGVVVRVRDDRRDALNDTLRSRQSRKFAGATSSRSPGTAARRCQIVITRSASTYGNGLKRSVSRSVMIETEPPMPIARMNTADSVNVGDFRSIRAPCRRSCTMSASAVNWRRSQAASGRAPSTRRNRSIRCLQSSWRRASSRADR